MRLVYLGSGAFGLPTLQRLVQGHEVALVVSQPDRPAGRKRRLTPTPVAEWAESQGLDVLKTEDANQPEVVTQVAELEPDAGVVIAFGQKLSPELIASLGRLAVNLHASLLPSYRGAAPIARAVMAGEPETGVSVIGLAQRMDAGAVYATASMPIDPQQTAGEVHDRLSELGPDAIGAVLADLQADRLEPIEQDEGRATRAPKLTKAEGTVSFEMSAERVRARVHGLTPWPGCTVAWATPQGEERRLILRRVEAEPDAPAGAAPGTVLEDCRVAASGGVVRLLELQGPGTKLMPASAFAAGHQFEPGVVLKPLES